MFHARPPRRRRTPPVDELYISEMLDRLSLNNPKACIQALQNKAYYLLDQAKGIIARSARESLVLFEPSDPLCGLGIYSHIRPFVIQADELIYQFCVELHEAVYHTPTNLLTVAVAQGAAKLECSSTPVADTWYVQVRNTLAKIRRTEKVAELRPYFDGLSITQEEATIYILASRSLQTLDKPAG